jgi:seryl-tRNA synthetase
MIQKREFNPELSLVGNLLLDIVDYRERVVPLANDLALLDATRKYQRVSVDELERERNEFINQMGSSKGDKGYSSGEITEGK